MLGKLRRMSSTHRVRQAPQCSIQRVLHASVIERAVVHCNDIPKLIQRSAEGANILSPVLHLTPEARVTSRVCGLMREAVINRSAPDQGGRAREVYLALIAHEHASARSSLLRGLCPALTDANSCN